jgi:cytochrome d ubiquinol oxidase subunit I
MVAIGSLYLLIMVWAAVLWWRGRLFEHRRFLWSLVAVQPLGFFATELGWVTTEVGRQPWMVYGLLRTAQGASSIPAGSVLWSLILFLIIFVIVGLSYLYYVIRTLRVGPDLTSPIPPVQRPIHRVRGERTDRMGGMS